MNLAKTERLLILLRQHGVSHFKTHEVEIDLKGEKLEVVSPTSDQAKPPLPDQSELGNLTPHQMEIPHHINEVASLLKLDDNALAERLFPEGAGV